MLYRIELLLESHHTRTDMYLEPGEWVGMYRVRNIWSIPEVQAVSGAYPPVVLRAPARFFFTAKAMESIGAYLVYILRENGYKIRVLSLDSYDLDDIVDEWQATIPLQDYKCAQECTERWLNYGQYQA